MPVVLSDAEYKKLLGKTSPKAKKRSPSKACPEGKVRHPKTGRCRKSKAKSPCPEGKVRHSQTGRCRRSLIDIAGEVLEKKRAKISRAQRSPTQKKRPLNAYQQHMKDTINELKELESRGAPPMTAKERFRVAVEAWREMQE